MLSAADLPHLYTGECADFFELLLAAFAVQQDGRLKRSFMQNYLEEITDETSKPKILEMFPGTPDVEKF